MKLIKNTAKLLLSTSLSLTAIFGTVSEAEAVLVTGGNATFVFNNDSLLFSGGGGPFIMDRYYGPGVATETGAAITAGVGGTSIVVPPSLVNLLANFNGSSVINPTGRARQTTNLDVDFSNVLGTWVVGEQIGIDFVLRTDVDPLFGGGTIVLGDFSLANNSGTLVLVNNFLFPADTFTIGSPVITDLGTGFSVSGDLLVSTSLSLLTGGFVPVGTDAGSFSLVAIPEPSSLALLTLAAGGLWLSRRKRSAGC